jgi:tungstate transport system ATP-binding protein
MSEPAGRKIHPPVYRLRNLVKDYANRRVLDIESLDIYRGEILSIVGPSGSGKSTLLRLLNFLEHPTSGNITFQGVEYSTGQDMRLEMRRKVTTVFQHPVLLEGSVWDNVMYGLRLRGNNHGKDTVMATLEEVGLVHLVRERARTLSGGEAQRVALARALVLKPDVLLLDEPTANLDPYNVRLIEEIIAGINKEIGITIVLVTHNVFQARRLASRVAFMLEGKFIEVAETAKFFESPADSRTSAFVRGDMIY